MPETPNSIESQTLSQRLAGGRIPVIEALRYAMMLADTLRRLHDDGRAHGALSPRCVILTDGKLELLPATAPQGAITPYTAPEALEGRTDAHSDMFAFGAILYEMLTGRRAFEGEGAALATALATAAPPPSGSPLVDRLVGNCMAKDPASRWPRMQKVLMELKLLTVAARRAETPAPARRAEAPDFSEVRREMRQLEERIAARLDSHEKAMAEMREAVAQAARAMSEQAAAARAEVEALRETPSSPGPDAEALEARVSERIARHFGTADERIARIEQALHASREESAAFQRNAAADLHDLETGLGAQEAAVSALRTAVKQTDDLVERVVEALESLQCAVLDQDGDRATAFSTN